MLTKKQIQDIASETLMKHGVPICEALNRDNAARDGYGFSGANLVALMEIFAEKLDAAKSQDIVAVIDARMGGGWTRSLAQALSAGDSV